MGSALRGGAGLRADADRDVVKERLREGVLDGGDVGFAQVGANQADTTVYIEADPAR